MSATIGSPGQRVRDTQPPPARWASSSEPAQRHPIRRAAAVKRHATDHRFTPEDPYPTTRPPAAPASAPEHPAGEAPRPAASRGPGPHGRSARRPHRAPTERHGTPTPTPERRTRRPESTTSRHTRRSPPSRPDDRWQTDPPETPARRRSRPGPRNTPATGPRTTSCNASPIADPKRRVPTLAETRQPPTRVRAPATGPRNGDTNAPCAEAQPQRHHQTPTDSATRGPRTQPEATTPPASDPGPTTDAQSAS